MATGFAFRRHDEPEAIAAQPVHVRINHNVVAAAAAITIALPAAQHRQRALAGEMVGRNGAVRGDITA